MIEFVCNFPVRTLWVKIILTYKISDLLTDILARDVFNYSTALNVQCTYITVARFIGKYEKIVDVKRRLCTRQKNTHLGRTLNRGLNNSCLQNQLLDE